MWCLTLSTNHFHVFIHPHSTETLYPSAWQIANISICSQAILLQGGWINAKPYYMYNDSDRMAPDSCLKLHWRNRQPEAHEILMFVCLQKDAKQCCEVVKLDRTHCVGRCSAQQNEYNWALWRHRLTALFGIFLETHKHLNRTRLTSWLHKQTSKSHL